MNIDNIISLINKHEVFSIKEVSDINDTLYNLTKQYILEHLNDIMFERFDLMLNNYIYNVYISSILKLYSPDCKHIVYFKLDNIFKKVKTTIYTQIIPPRSYKYSFIRNIKDQTERLDDKLLYLRNLSQPAQRSEEWYEFRHNLITASSLHKIFGTESVKNQLIYEKCQPYVKFGNNISLDSPLHWGQKYEPISIKFYEDLYGTKIEDFGCIKHKTYEFIGASPDGINICKNNPRYGRMLEIKNVVSRKITGIPKFEYWIQMQLQMETCNLNECDFLETKFIEYENEDEFMKDGSFVWSADKKLKGHLILFSNNGQYHYEYAPLYISEDKYLDWEQTILKKNENMEWIQNIYWKLERYSNILVLRNKLWFAHVIPEIKKFWDIIIAERISGYEHRAPNKKRKTSSNTILVQKCQIDTSIL